MSRAHRQSSHSSFPAREVLTPSQVEDYRHDVVMLSGVDPWDIRERLARCPDDSSRQTDLLFKIAYAAQHARLQGSPQFPPIKMIERSTDNESSHVIKTVGSAALACVAAGCLYGVWKVTGQMMTKIDLESYKNGYIHFVRGLSGR